MGQLVPISNILQNGDFRAKDGEFIELHTLWYSSVIHTRNPKLKIYRFMFANTEGQQIGAILHQRDNNSHNAQNVYEKLKGSGRLFRLTNFTAEKIRNESWKVVRSNNVQIVISPSTLNIEVCELSSLLPLPCHFPFDFTQLNDVDACKIGDIIDVIGYATELLKKQKTRENIDYNTVILCSHYPKADGEKKCSSIPRLHKASYQKNSVYALLNVRVGEFGQGTAKNKTLQTTGNTIITTITLDSLEKLPDFYRTQHFIYDLFPKKSRRSSNRAKQNENKDLCRAYPTYTEVLDSVDCYEPRKYQTGFTGSGYYDWKSVTNDLPEPIAGPSTSIYGNEQPVFTISMPDLSPSCGSDSSYSSYSSISSMKRCSMSASGSEPNTKKMSRKSCSKIKTKLSDFPRKIYDFKLNTNMLKVFVKKAEKPVDTRNWYAIFVYPMESKPRGRVLIINNHTYSGKDERIRVGSLIDDTHLKHLFIGLEFEVITTDDVTSDRLTKEIDMFKAEFDTNMDACVVVILSHGVEGYVEMVDGNLVHLNHEIIFKFDERQFPVMQGKPKIFFVQKCESVLNQKMLSRVERANEKLQQNRQLELRNMIIVYATPSGTSALRDKYKGSPFIYVLVDTLMDHAHEAGFRMLLEVVQDRMKNVVLPKEEKLVCEWKPWHFKDLFFNPGC